MRGGTDQAARLPIGGSPGGAEGSQYRECCSEVLERVCLWTTSSDVKQLAEEDHGGVGLAGPTGTRQDDGLGVAGVPLDPHRLLGHLEQSCRVLGRLAGGVEGEGVAHIGVGVDRQQNGSNVGLVVRALSLW